MQRLADFIHRVIPVDIYDALEAMVRMAELLAVLGFLIFVFQRTGNAFALLLFLAVLATYLLFVLRQSADYIVAQLAKGRSLRVTMSLIMGLALALLVALGMTISVALDFAASQ